MERQSSVWGDPKLSVLAVVMADIGYEAVMQSVASISDQVDIGMIEMIRDKVSSQSRKEFPL